MSGSVDFLKFETRQLPGGDLLECQPEPELVVWVFRRRRSIIKLPQPGQNQLIVTSEDETCLYMQAVLEDVPAIAALLVESARKRQPPAAPGELAGDAA